MHLQNPIMALDSISRVSADKIIVIDTVDISQEDRYAHLEFGADNPSGHFIWWVYSIGLYREVFAMMGYQVVSVVQHFYTLLDETGAKDQAASSEVLLTTVTAERKK